MGALLFEARAAAKGMRDSYTTSSMISEPERPLKRALWRGWRRRCPNCGQDTVLENYLSVKPSCTACQEDFTAARADDGPAYLTILIVGHLIAPLLHIVFVRFRPEPLVMFSFFAVGTVALSLFLLPRFKGMVIAFQWARYMHGFGSQDEAVPHEPSHPSD